MQRAVFKRLVPVSLIEKVTLGLRLMGIEEIVIQIGKKNISDRGTYRMKG